MDVRPPDPPKANRWKRLKARLASLTGAPDDRPPHGDFTQHICGGGGPAFRSSEPTDKGDEIPPEEDEPGYEDDGVIAGLIDRTPRPPPPKRARRPSPPPPRESYVEPETTAGVPAHRPAEPPDGKTEMGEDRDS